MSEFPAFEASLLRAARRRYGWRRWRPRVAVALVAAAAAGGVMLLLARPAPRDPEHVARPWRTVSVPAYGVDVSLPRGWRIAPRSLTPHLLDPHEIVSATTFVAGAPIEGCAMLPAAALRRMRATDALVTVQERGKGSPGFAPRPVRFVPAGGRLDAGGCAGSFGGSLTSTSFSDGPRNLTVLVALGAGASSSVRGEAYAIVDRMRFDARFVPWWPFSG